MENYASKEWFERGKYLDLLNHNIFLVEEGSGEPLILLHGFPTSSWDWHKILPTLTSTHTVIAPDFLGFGFSDKPHSAAYSISTQADIIEAIIEHYGFSPLHILAHDYGDTVAQELLARQQSNSYQIMTVALLNGGLFPETHRPVIIQKLLISPLGPIISKLITKKKFENSFSAVFGENSKPSQNELDVFWEIMNYNNGLSNYHKLIRYMKERKTQREKWVRALQDHKGQLSLINGLEDPVSGRHMVDRYRALVSMENIYALEEIGHYPQTESPQQVLEAYLDFRNRLGN